MRPQLSEILSERLTYIAYARVDETLADKTVAVLSEDEEKRAECFYKAIDRARFRSAHLLKRRLHSSLSGLPEISQEYVIDAAGKPHWKGGPGCWFNLSHAGAFVAIAISDTGVCGVDVEVLRSMRRATLPWLELLHAEELSRIGHVLPPEDQLALYLWTQKEAASKAIGLGLALPFDQIITPEFCSGELRTAKISICSAKYQSELQSMGTWLDTQSGGGHFLSAVVSSGGTGFYLYNYDWCAPNTLAGTQNGRVILSG